MRRYTAVFFLLLVSFSAALADSAQQSKTDPIRIAALDGGRLQLRQSRIAQTISIENDFHGCSAQLTDSLMHTTNGGLGYQVRVVDEVSKGGRWYLLLQVDSSPNCNVQGMCGAGNNTDVVWLKLDRRLKVLAPQAEFLDDCAGSRALLGFTGDKVNPEGLEMRGGVVRVRVENEDKNQYMLQYSHQAPEKGIVRLH